jgi:hypothetical protein
MSDTIYKINLTGDQINARLQLIDGDNTSVQVKTKEVSTTEGKLATQDYVKNYVDTTKVVITSGNQDLEDGVSKLESGKLYLVY